MSFGKQLEGFEKEAIKQTEQTARGTAIALWRDVIFATPVDTGRARGNWFATDSKPSQEINTTITDKTGTKAISSAVSFTQSAGDWQSLWLTNNLPYIEKLEEGSSTQAPAGMVRVNVARFQRILNEQARKNNK